MTTRTSRRWPQKLDRTQGADRGVGGGGAESRLSVWAQNGYGPHRTMRHQAEIVNVWESDGDMAAGRVECREVAETRIARAIAHMSYA